MRKSWNRTVDPQEPYLSGQFFKKWCRQIASDRAGFCSCVCFGHCTLGFLLTYHSKIPSWLNMKGVSFLSVHTLKSRDRDVISNLLMGPSYILISKFRKKIIWQTFKQGENQHTFLRTHFSLGWWLVLLLDFIHFSQVCEMVCAYSQSNGFP